MSTHRARRSKVVGAVLGVAVALAALGATVAVTVGTGAVDQVAVYKMTEIERLAPLTPASWSSPGTGTGQRVVEHDHRVHARRGASGQSQAQR